MIPLFATRGALAPLLGEVAARQRDVLESGRYVLGPELSAFESEFAAYIGREQCVGVASGTDALTLALRSLGVGADDEVVVPGMSFFATAEAVVNAGAQPVFADIDPDTYCLTAATTEPAIGSRTKAIMPVHLFGNPAPMGELMALAAEHDLVVVEDAAQAAGAQLGQAMAGSLGDAAAFSFYPGKNLGAFGDGGAIVFRSADAADRARSLRDHGRSSERWVHRDVGLNSRLDDLQAAGLRVLLPELDEWTGARRRTARAYDEGLATSVAIPTQTPGAEAAYHLYVIRTPDRAELEGALLELGIESRAYYTTPLHRQPAFAHLGHRAALPYCDRIAAEGLALPMGPSLDDESVATVVEAVRGASER